MDTIHTAERKSIEELASIEYADASNTSFALENDFLSMTHKGERYAGVRLQRSLPFEAPDEYVSVQDSEGKELAILRDVRAFDPATASLLQSEMNKRYFNPRITGIASIKNKMGYLYFDVSTSAGPKTFALSDVSRNLRSLPDGKILVIDVDGNRYTIEDAKDLPSADMKKLEPWLF